VSDTFFQAKAFFSYWLDSVDEHSLHSPFYFDFYTNVVKGKSYTEGYAEIERLRYKLISDVRPITVDDYGTGHNEQRRISDIATSSMSPQKYSALYARIIRHFKAQNILELGTSLGINSLYLGLKKDTKVTTFEGSNEVADLAALTFEFANAKNINIIRGNIDVTLPSYLQTVRKIDLAFIDANHRYRATLKYFELILPKLKENSVLVFDDIHYSVEMERAWNEISRHHLVYGSADLFRCGILFFDPSLNKQNVILQF
jgi:predicted O-methyltransferase YrrM